MPKRFECIGCKRLLFMGSFDKEITAVHVSQILYSDFRIELKCPRCKKINIFELNELVG